MKFFKWPQSACPQCGANDWAPRPDDGEGVYICLVCGYICMIT